MRHAEAHVAVFAILEAKHFVTDSVPTSRFLPNLRRMQRGQVEFLATDAVHLFAQNRHNLERHALRHWQVRIDSGAELANQTSAQQEFVRNDFGVCRILAKCRDKVL